MKILLCEDDSNIATIARMTLEQIGGHQVTWVNDGAQALETGLKSTHDLILLDDMMPKMSGVEVCRAYVKSQKKIPPVIFLSANPQQQKVEEFKSVAIGYIPKPFDPMTLNQQIELIMKSTYQQAV